MGALFAELTIGSADPSWPAAGSSRTGEVHLGLLRTAVRIESLEARPEKVFRILVVAASFAIGWAWRLEPPPAGRGVIHDGWFETTDRWAGRPRPARARIDRAITDAHLRALKERAESPADEAAGPAGVTRPPPVLRSPACAGTRRPSSAGCSSSFGLWLVPDLTPPSSVPPPVTLVHARIVEFLAPSDEPGTPDARVIVVDGPNAGSIIDAFLQGPSGQQDVPRYDVGDEVIVNISQQGEDADFVAVADRYRVPALAALLGLFAVAVTLVGGWRGVRSLIALALTLAVIIRIVVPLLLAGWDPVPLAVGAGDARHDRHAPR